MPASNQGSDCKDSPSNSLLVGGFSPTRLKNMRVRQIGSWNPNYRGETKQTLVSTTTSTPWKLIHFFLGRQKAWFRAFLLLVWGRGILIKTTNPQNLGTLMVIKKKISHRKKAFWNTNTFVQSKIRQNLKILDPAGPTAHIFFGKQPKKNTES